MSRNYRGDLHLEHRNHLSELRDAERGEEIARSLGGVSGIGRTRGHQGCEVSLLIRLGAFSRLCKFCLSEAVLQPFRHWPHKSQG